MALITFGLLGAAEVRTGAGDGLAAGDGLGPAGERGLGGGLEAAGLAVTPTGAGVRTEPRLEARRAELVHPAASTTRVNIQAA